MQSLIIYDSTGKIYVVQRGVTAIPSSLHAVVKDIPDGVESLTIDATTGEESYTLNEYEKMKAELTYLSIENGTYAGDDDEIGDKIGKWCKGGAWSTDRITEDFVDDGYLSQAQYRNIKGVDYVGDHEHGTGYRPV